MERASLVAPGVLGLVSERETEQSSFCKLCLHTLEEPAAFHSHCMLWFVGA